MHVREAPRLLCHRARHRFHAVPDRHHRRAARRVQKSPTVVRVDEAAFAAHRAWIFFQEISRENRFVGHGRRLAYRSLRNQEARGTFERIGSRRAHPESRAILAEIAPPSPSRLHAHCHLIFFTLIVGSGNFSFMLSSASTITCETARFRNHFLFDGITNHGASSVLHSINASSYAS